MQRRSKFVAGLLGLSMLTLAACSEGEVASDTDIDEPRFQEDVQPIVFESRQPDSIEVIFNVDNHPNLVRLCFDGLAFMTVSTSHQSWTPSYQRMPEWDAVCATRIIG